MNKKFIALALCTATAGSMVTILATTKGGNSFVTLAGDDCEGYHYAQVDPTKSTAGHREFWVCCKHHEISLTEPQDGKYVDQTDDKMIGGLDSKHAAYLPEISDTAYTQKSVTFKDKDGKVYDSIEYTLIDTTYGTFKINFKTAELPYYIQAGTSYYSIAEWNDLYPNAFASVNGTDLTFTLKEGTTTVVKASDGKSDLDGTFDLLLFNSVTIKGAGELNIAFNADYDGVDVNNLTIQEGSTFNLKGMTYEKKSGLKVRNTLNVNGTLNVSDFNYGLAINQKQSGASLITINVGTTGVVFLNNVNNGFGQWNNSFVLNVNGYCNVTNVYTRGISSEAKIAINVNSTGHLLFDKISSDGIYSNNNLKLSIEGECKLDNITGNGIWIDSITKNGKDDNYNIPSTIVVSGNGSLEINSGSHSIFDDKTNDQSYDSSTDKNFGGKKTYDLTLKGNSTFVSKSADIGIDGFNHFEVLENASCKVTVTGNVNCLRNAKLNNDIFFTINSSKEALFESTVASSTQAAIYFRSDSTYACSIYYRIYTSMRVKNCYAAFHNAVSAGKKWKTSNVYTKNMLILENTPNIASGNSSSYDAAPSNLIKDVVRV